MQAQFHRSHRYLTPFQNHRWPQDVIVMAVRWYFRYGLSAASVRDLLAERGMDVSRQTIAAWVQKFGGLLATAARRYARRVGWRWFVDETYVRVGKTWAYLYRAVDEAGQVVDVLLRDKRNLESAEAFFEQAVERGGVVPDEVITDKHRAYLQAVRRHAPKAKHRRTGLHRKRALTTKPIERSHVSIKGRLRPMRALASIGTGQRLLEGVELAQAVQRGDVRPPHQRAPSSVHERSRLEVATFSWLASGLRTVV
jgi:transposase, IS6 family